MSKKMNQLALTTTEEVATNVAWGGTNGQPNLNLMSMEFLMLVFVVLPFSPFLSSI